MITKVLIRPILVGIVAYVVAEGMSTMTRNVFGFYFSTLFSVFTAFFACVVTAFWVRAITVKDGSVCFGGESISKFLTND